MTLDQVLYEGVNISQIAITLHKAMTKSATRPAMSKLYGVLVL